MLSDRQATGVLASLVPPDVAVAQVAGEHNGSLMPAERAVSATWSPKRIREFAAGRTCARIALGAHGHAPVALLPGPKRAPHWPAGFVGSITHCRGFAAAAVARRRVRAAVGIDAEPDEPLPRGVLASVASPLEMAQLGQLGDVLGWGRVLFSAKESVYKVWQPLTGRWLGFHDARVRLEPAEGRFSVRLCVPDPHAAGLWLDELEGRFVRARGRILTAVVVPAVRPIPTAFPPSFSLCI